MNTIVLETFEGPLDLLLHLIREHKVSIYDIPIFEITKQYLDYLSKMNEYNIEVASEFLVLASTLISIKVKLLLPRERDEDTGEVEDPRLDLVKQLLEYERFKGASLVFQALLEDQGKSSYRPRDEELYNQVSKDVNALENVGPNTLYDVITYIMERVVERKIPPYEVKMKQISVKDKIERLMQLLHRTPELYFNDIIDYENKSDVVLSFLALLDLYKQGVVSMYQTDNFSPIKITVRQDIEHAI